MAQPYSYVLPGINIGVITGYIACTGYLFAYVSTLFSICINFPSLNPSSFCRIAFCGSKVVSMFDDVFGNGCYIRAVYQVSGK